ncbi:class I SAM-dependent methyltransferase [Actinomadura barringtoniae]|uniref:Class I SAM-dependent methyltransferase n=1 Tax=Actinomadura barringtoniae TaxID=1427535 RepID=A0A939PGR0_9ACTN|nr:class I SAM-dependent methyltransferase [Actinomadura barringtoniae]MBO2448201.1 class I SAM-dependent methyltransferase [Actinomadura barringtoniae]
MSALTPNPVRGRLNSVFFALMSGYINQRLARHKRKIFPRTTGVVAEIGAGNGPNLRYLPPKTTVHAIEPNPYFHKRLERAAARHDIDLIIHPVPGEAIDLPDASVDAVLCTWVLCTVDDPAQVLREIHRILRPGGQLAFVEHVAAPHGPVRRIQRLVRRPWRWAFEGCHTDRDTAAAIRATGFASVDITNFRFRSTFVPVRTQIAGTALR